MTYLKIIEGRLGENDMYETDASHNEIVQLSREVDERWELIELLKERGYRVNSLQPVTLIQL